LLNFSKFSFKVDIKSHWYMFVPLSRNNSYRKCLKLIKIMPDNTFCICVSFKVIILVVVDPINTIHCIKNLESFHKLVVFVWSTSNINSHNSSWNDKTNLNPLVIIILLSRPSSNFWFVACHSWICMFWIVTWRPWHREPTSNSWDSLFLFYLGQVLISSILRCLELRLSSLLPQIDICLFLSNLKTFLNIEFWFTKSFINHLIFFL